MVPMYVVDSAHTYIPYTRIETAALGSRARRVVACCRGVGPTAEFDWHAGMGRVVVIALWLILRVFYVAAGRRACSDPGDTMGPCPWVRLPMLARLTSTGPTGRQGHHLQVAWRPQPLQSLRVCSFSAYIHGLARPAWHTCSMPGLMATTLRLQLTQLNGQAALMHMHWHSDWHLLSERADVIAAPFPTAIPAPTRTTHACCSLHLPPSYLPTCAGPSAKGDGAAAQDLLQRHRWHNHARAQL